MKKIILTLVSILSVYSFLFAKQIDIQTAQNVAQTFLSGTTTLRSTPLLKLVYTDKNQTLLRSGQAENYYYVFNIGNNNGFIIISADDVNVPVIGYSLQGSYDPNDLPPNFKGWMEDVRMGMKEAISKGETPNEKVASNWQVLQSGINPIQPGTPSINNLIKTAWSQDGSAIPLKDNGQEVAAGCVATAVAQIMKYHNYPRSGIKSTEAYTTLTKKYNVPSIDLTKVVYKWGEMLNKYEYSSPANNKYARAELLYHCGAALKTDYTYLSSAAYSEDVSQVLVEYFGYDPGLRMITRSATGSDEAWKSILKYEIDNKRPVYYSGGTREAGHAWVCDGYEANGFMSFNWGWGGYSAYYNIDAAYTANQSAIIGIKPKSTSATCAIPTELSSNYYYITESSAPLKWNAVSGAQSYTLQYKKSSSNTWITVGTITTTSYTLTGLSPATAYIWQVRANCSSSSSSAYTASSFTTKALPSACVMGYEPNETMEAAHPINTNTTYSAGISNHTDRDYYKFTLATIQDVVVNLQNPQKDYELKVYDATGRELGIGTTKGTADETVILDYLAAGTYYVYVYGYGGNYDVSKCYNLRVTTTAPAKPGGLKLLQINSNQATISWEPLPDAQSYTLQYKKNSASTWTTVSSSLTVTRYNFTGLESATGYTWQVRANYSSSPYSGYTLSSFTTLLPAASGIHNYEPNDDIASAYKITTNYTYTAGIGSSTDRDYYKFTLCTRGNIVITLTNLPKNYTLFLLDSSGVLSMSYNSGIADEKIEYNNLAAGTYYIYVYGENGAYDLEKCYNLRLTAPVSPCVNNYEPNELGSSAYPINVNQTYYAGISSPSDSDFYTFTLTETSNIHATLEDLPANYNLVVYDPSWKVIGHSYKWDTENESISLNNLPAGKYLVGVSNPNKVYDTLYCYSLRVSTTATRSLTSTIDEKSSDLEEDLFIYPNPADDILHVKSENATIKNITLTNVSGITVLRKTFESNSDEIYIRELPSGVYIVTIETDMGITSKLIQKQ